MIFFRLVSFDVELKWAKTRVPPLHAQMLRGVQAPGESHLFNLPLLVRNAEVGPQWRAQGLCGASAVVSFGRLT